MPLTRIKNLKDIGTKGSKVAVGTTGQRGSTTGEWRFNTTTGFFEGRNENQFSTLEPTPTVSSVDVSEVDSQAGGNQTIVITGTNFSSGGTISFVGSSATFNAATTTFNSATQVTAVAPKASFLNAQEPYKVKFASSSGISGTSAVGLINVDTSPTWTTSAGSLGTITDIATGTHATVAATDADGDTIAYSVQSGSLPAGTSLNTTSGVISGDPTNVSNATTSNFTLRATANSKTVDRAFSIITNPGVDGTSSARAFSTMSDISGLGLTGHQTLYTTLGGNTTAFQVDVDCTTAGGPWILVSFNFTTAGGISNAQCQDTAFGGKNSSNWHYTSTGRYARTLNLGLGEGVADGHDIYGENITLSDSASNHASYGLEDVSSSPGNTSNHSISYYNHGTTGNFTSGQVTALRAFATSMYTGIPHVATEVDASDGGSSYDFTTAYNDNTQANLGHTTILKNAAGNKLRPQVRKDGTDEHWSASLWTHNTYSQTSTSGVFRENLSSMGDPTNVGLGVGANGWLFPSTINYQASTGGGANFGTPYLRSWSNGEGGTGNYKNSKVYFMIKG
tara:strand:+ start:24 stop:1715 length:1692 start_codon:yes stop_codon:yes gene_type:complete